MALPFLTCASDAARFRKRTLKARYVGLSHIHLCQQLAPRVWYAGSLSKRVRAISLDLDGKRLTGPLEIASTKNDADPVAWRQWHHWNVMKEIPVGRLPKGKHVLAVHILTNGNMNLAYFDFKQH